MVTKIPSPRHMSRDYFPPPGSVFPGKVPLGPAATHTRIHFGTSFVPPFPDRIVIFRQSSQATPPETPRGYCGMHPRKVNARSLFQRNLAELFCQSQSRDGTLQLGAAHRKMHRSDLPLCHPRTLEVDNATAGGFLVVRRAKEVACTRQESLLHGCTA